MFPVYFLALSFSSVLCRPASEVAFGERGSRSKYGKPSEESGKLVDEWNQLSGINPEELGEYMEGDILHVVNSKNGLLNESARWEGAVVPYVIKGPYNQKELTTIFAAMDHYHNKTCIRFRRKKKDDADYITIVNTRTGCWSSVGKTSGEQFLNLQSPGCLSTLGTPVHEFMHAIGFYHEQSRFDRDDYVTILWENIEMGKESNFNKVENGTTTAFGEEYDYGSVMHYSDHAFSKNDKPTIVAKKEHTKLGQRVGLSEVDIAKLRKMYNCSAVDESTLTTEEPSYVTESSSILETLITILFG